MCQNLIPSVRTPFCRDSLSVDSYSDEIPLSELDITQVESFKYQGKWVRPIQLMLQHLIVRDWQGKEYELDRQSYVSDVVYKSKDNIFSVDDKVMCNIGISLLINKGDEGVIIEYNNKKSLVQFEHKRILYINNKHLTLINKNEKNDKIKVCRRTSKVKRDTRKRGVAVSSRASRAKCKRCNK